jgi:hypothetical protein
MAIINGKVAGRRAWPLAVSVLLKRQRPSLGIRGIGRRREEQKVDRCVLREEFEPYSAIFDPENGRLSPNNNYYWDIYGAYTVR